MSKIFDAVHHAEIERRQYASASPMARNTLQTERHLPGSEPMVRSGSPSAVSGGAWAPAAPKAETWEEAVILATKQLETCERELAEQSGIQSKCQERLARLDEEKKQASSSYQQASEKAALLEKSRLVWTRQLEALKECAALSQAYHEMHQALEVNRKRIAVTEESQKQLAQTLAEYKDQQAGFQKQAEQIRFRLASALAATGTTDPSIS